MATHEELITELPRLDKLSNAARLKHAKKRRLKQLKRYQEYVRQQRALAATASTGGIMKRRAATRVAFEDGSILNDMVSRNELLEVRQLLEKGIDPNISNADGLTPLHKCCIDNTVELASILLEYGADLNARDVEGWTPLHAASATGNLHMINLLLEEGASLTAINLDDKMPVDVAADTDIRYVLQQRMLEAGYTDDVLEYLRVSMPKNMLADLKDSTKHGRSLNIQDKYGATALHVAAANGYTDVLGFILAQVNVDLNIQDVEGWTPFHAAVCWEQQDAMKQLAEKGASMDIKNLHGETAYAIAEEPEIRELILQLKSEYGQLADQAVEEAEAEKSEELGPRTRRLSVRRTRQADKNNMMRDSIKEEALIRRASMVRQDKDRGLMSKQDSSDVVLDDEECSVRLTSVTKLTTGDSVDVTSQPRTSTPPPPSPPPPSPPPPSPPPSSAAVESEKLPDRIESERVGSTDQSSHDKDAAGNDDSSEDERGREETSDKEEDEDREGNVSKRGTQRAIQKMPQRPDSIEIDDQLSPTAAASSSCSSSCRNPRKSVLRKTNPTPVHSGPTYTCTSPVGEPYDSEGRRRGSSGNGRECCSVM